MVRQRPGSGDALVAEGSGGAPATEGDRDAPVAGFLQPFGRARLTAPEAVAV